jgi:hypothetical protein
MKTVSGHSKWFRNLSNVKLLKCHTISGSKTGDDKELGIASWFSEYYGSSRDSLLTFFRTKICPVCEFAPTPTTRDKKRAMTRHLCTHLEKSLPCPICYTLLTNDNSLHMHRRKCCGKSEKRL